MPAPDVQYVLDSSVQCGHIGGDTHFYLMEMATNAEEIVDSYSDENERETHWQRLLHMGLYFEEQYLDWRFKNPDKARMASYEGLQSVSSVFREIVHSSASKMVETNHKTMNRDAIAVLDRSYEFTDTLNVMRRSLARANHDFSGWSHSRIESTRDYIENNRLVAIESIRDYIENNKSASYNWIDLPSDNNVYIWPQKNRASVKQTQKMLRDKVDSDKRMIKRSIKFLTKLIGYDTTRVFINGGNIRFEGEHAIYELRKFSDMTSSHGGFRALSVFDKVHTNLLLCDICIYTPTVPLLDHVANIIMHIQAGEEDEILRIGNARNVNALAYEKEWLAPYLPSKENKSLPLLGGLFGETPETRAARKLEEMKMRKLVAKYIYNSVISEFAPLLRSAQIKLNHYDHSITDPLLDPRPILNLTLDHG